MHGNKLLRGMTGLVFLERMAYSSSIKSDFMFRKETGASVLSGTGIYTLEFHCSSCLKSAVCVDDAVLREREPSFSDQREKQTAEVIFVTDAVGLLWSSGSPFTRYKLSHSL